MADIEQLLGQLIELHGSDLHIKAGSVPYIRIGGRLGPTELPVLTPSDTEQIAYAMLPEERTEEFRLKNETDFALGVQGVGRFRVSMMRQRGSIGMMLKRVITTPPSFDALGLPAAVRQLSERRHGLVLVTGPAGSGRSTTLATMLDHLNTTATVSILTIENPIEVLHADKKAFISQREIGTDTKSYVSAIDRALRHDADVIFVDQILDAEVMSLLLTAASGRLVLSSLPTLTAEETVRTVVDFFPAHQVRQNRQALASVLQGIISQRLLDREEDQGRVAAFELLISTPRVHDSIAEVTGSATLESLIVEGEYYGMQTMDKHLAELYHSRLISMGDALAAASHPQELRVQLTHAPS